MNIFNKKAMDPMILVTIIALLATFVVFLIIVFPPFKTLIFGAGESGACQFSTLLSAMSKQITFGFGEIPAECKMERKTIKADDIERYRTLAKRATKRYADQNLPAQTYFVNSEYGWNEWALQKIVADDMVECFNKGWRGKLDLKSGFLASQIEVMSEETGAYLCILCTRIKFDPSVNDVIHNPTSTRQMKDWLDWNNKEGKTYYALLTEGTNELFQGFVTNAHFDIDKPAAVVFVAGYEKQSGGLAKSIGGVTIANYDTLTTDLGFKGYKVVDIEIAEKMIAGPISTYFAEKAGLFELQKKVASYLGIDVNKVKITEAPAKCKYVIGD